MEARGLTGGFYWLCHWITRLAYLNVLWIGFSIAGLVIFGLFPSTAGMFAVTRKWVAGEPDVAVFQVFWRTFKKEFMKSNLLGFIYVMIGFILIWDLKYFASQEGIIYQSITMAILPLLFVYMVSTMYIFPMFVHYEAKTLQHIKNSILIAVVVPARTIGMVMGSIGLIFTVLYFPKLLLFFSGSLLSLIIMKSAYHSFEKVDELKAKSEAEVDQRKMNILENY